jgi:hypothetical protein
MRASIKNWAEPVRVRPISGEQRGVRLPKAQPRNASFANRNSVNSSSYVARMNGLLASSASIVAGTVASPARRAASTSLMRCVGASLAGCLASKPMALEAEAASGLSAQARATCCRRPDERHPAVPRRPVFHDACVREALAGFIYVVGLKHR